MMTNTEGGRAKWQKMKMRAEFSWEEPQKIKAVGK
jgi:hypothetical protein